VIFGEEVNDSVWARWGGPWMPPETTWIPYQKETPNIRGKIFLANCKCCTRKKARARWQV
jgi:hypothetical protein